MSEFIDREKAIANIKAAYCCGCEHYNGVRCRACQIMDAMDVLEDAPTVVPDVQRWRDPDKDPPKVEEEVLILFETACGGYGITTAHYEDGTLLSQDSIFYWDELAAWGELDEEHDDYIIPKGWWEYRHFNQDEVYNNRVDYPVRGWMPLPEVQKMKILNPCKDCPDRHPACHDHCPQFAAWRKEHAKETDYNRQMMVSGSVYHRDYEDKHRERGKKKYFGQNGGDK